MTMGAVSAPQAPAVASGPAWSARLLAIVGAALVLAAAWIIWQAVGVAPPYTYQRAGPVAGSERDRFEIRAAFDQALLAEGEVEPSAAGPVLAVWRTHVDDPLLYLPLPPLQEIDALAAALRRHAPDTPVFTWWDTGRLLKQRGVSGVQFDTHLRWPWFGPPLWRSHEAAVERVERAFWGEPDKAQRGRFEHFVDALLADETHGVQRMQAMAGASQTYVLALHLRDAIGLAQANPARFGLLMRGIDAPGDVHRAVRSVKDWLAQSGAVAYMLLPGGGPHDARALALADEASAATLAARLLPFIGNRQDDVNGLTLVHRVGGFLVYQHAGQASAQRD